MKSLKILMTVFLVVSTVLFSCGYGGGPGGGGSPECREYCQKTEGCCDTYPDCPEVDETDMAECLCNCTNMYRSASDEFLRGMEACTALPCGNETERQACLENLLTLCTTELIPAVDALCTRIDECSPDASYDECVYYYNQAAGCYSARAQSAMLSCSSAGTCETFNLAFEQCMNTQLGLLECHPDDY